MNDWGIAPPGSLATGGVSAAGGGKPLNPLLLAAAKYAVAAAYSEWLDDTISGAPSGVASAAAVDGSVGIASAGDYAIDAYLCAPWCLLLHVSMGSLHRADAREQVECPWSARGVSF